MVANDQEALEEIEDAIDRIFDGTYGVCLETKTYKQESQSSSLHRFSVEGQINLNGVRLRKSLGMGSFATLADPQWEKRLSRIYPPLHIHSLYFLLCFNILGCGW